MSTQIEAPKHPHVPLILYNESNHCLYNDCPQVSYDNLETLPVESSREQSTMFFIP